MPGKKKSYVSETASEVLFEWNGFIKGDTVIVTGLPRKKGRRLHYAFQSYTIPQNGPEYVSVLETDTSGGPQLSRAIRPDQIEKYVPPAPKRKYTRRVNV